MPRPLPFLDLFTRETAALPPPEPRWARRDLEVWIAVCLPSLPLESLPGATSEPAAVVEPLHGQLQVVAANAQARQCGIEPGIRLNAARALARSLKVLERSADFERGSLESLATWLQTMTPTVSIAPPDGVLLEVSRSLKLLQGLAAIKSRLGAELSKRGLTFRLCAAPTIFASLWLARGAAEDVSSRDELPGRLGALPLGVTRWPESTQALLRDLGARTIGDCLRLPRDGFARRAGATHLRELDLALGRRVDLRAEFVAPLHWHSALDLFEESADCSIFMEALEQMLDRLETDLRKRQAQIRNLSIAFRHSRRPPTREDFVLAELAHERARLSALLRDRVERLLLPAPVVAIELCSGPFEPMSLNTLGLFEKVSVETAARVLFERLRGRFGFAAVHGMGLIAEHRPERAWARVDCSGDMRRLGEAPAPQNRPLWLLRSPVPLESTAARRYYGGSVRLQSGPERIESGWWDEQDVGRDYYVAESSQGQRLWIYRDRTSRDWHLHGLFG
jgi:protein ImuB